MIFAKFHDRCGVFLRDAQKIFPFPPAISDIRRDAAAVRACRSREIGDADLLAARSGLKFSKSFTPKGKRWGRPFRVTAPAGRGQR